MLPLRLPGVGAVAAPRPIGWVAHHAGAQGIQINVAADFEQIGVLVDQNTLEPPLKKVADLVVAAVIGLGVNAVEALHQPREVGLPCMGDEVIVVVHQAISQHGGIEAIHRLANHGEKTAPILVILEDSFAPIATRGHVIDRAGEFDAQGAGHGDMMNPGEANTRLTPPPFTGEAKHKA